MLLTDRQTTVKSVPRQKWRR